VWLWFRSEGLKFPLRMHQGSEIRWVEASCTAIHQVLTNPVYAGAYVYGRTRHEIVLDATGQRKKRVRHLPRAEWQVLIPEHHPGFIDWQTYAANQERIAGNTKPGPHQAGGAVREVAHFCKGWPAAVIVVAVCTPTIAVVTPRQVTTARARFSSRTVASIASISAASRSTRPSPGPSPLPWNRLGLPPP
jgi:hypothetical protein